VEVHPGEGSAQHSAPRRGQCGSGHTPARALWQEVYPGEGSTPVHPGEGSARTVHEACHGRECLGCHFGNPILATGFRPAVAGLARPGAFPRKRVVATPFGPPDDGRGRSRRHRGKRAHRTFPIGDRLVWGEAVPSEACFLYWVPLVPSRGIPTHRQDAVQGRVGLIRAGATVGLGA
jgi:hypothetical protein